MRYLWMKNTPEMPYIEKTRKGIKTGTTRLHQLAIDDYELVSGSYYKPEKSGIIIKIENSIPFEPANATPMLKEQILKAEDFKTWEEYISVLEQLNKMKIELTTLLYFHPYKLIKDQSKDVIAFL